MENILNQIWKMCPNETAHYCKNTTKGNSPVLKTRQPASADKYRKIMKGKHGFHGLVGGEQQVNGQMLNNKEYSQLCSN